MAEAAQRIRDLEHELEEYRLGFDLLRLAARVGELEKAVRK